jgi:hypothetical protein
MDRFRLDSGSKLALSWLEAGSIQARSWFQASFKLARSWIDSGSIQAPSWLQAGILTWAHSCFGGNFSPLHADLSHMRAVLPRLQCSLAVALVVHLASQTRVSLAPQLVNLLYTCSTRASAPHVLNSFFDACALGLSETASCTEVQLQVVL